MLSPTSQYKTAPPPKFWQTKGQSGFLSHIHGDSTIMTFEQPDNQAITFSPTCSTCSYFQQYPNEDRGLCTVFDFVSKTYWCRTDTCELEIQEIEDQVIPAIVNQQYYSPDRCTHANWDNLKHLADVAGVDITFVPSTLDDREGTYWLTIDHNAEPYSDFYEIWEAVEMRLAIS